MGRCPKTEQWRYTRLTARRRRLRSLDCERQGITAGSSEGRSPDDGSRNCSTQQLMLPCSSARSWGWGVSLRRPIGQPVPGTRAAAQQPPAAGRVCISGIYPHLAAFNSVVQDDGQTFGSGGECGIGAVVPWAGKLWMLTYPPHCPTGSTDKLYAIDEQLNLKIRPESVGGTHAGPHDPPRKRAVDHRPLLHRRDGPASARSRTARCPAG